MTFRISFFNLVLVAVVIIGGIFFIKSDRALACHGDCGPPNDVPACAQACNEGGMASIPLCLDSPPANGHLISFGTGKRDNNLNCGGAGNCTVRYCFLDFACNPGYTRVGDSCQVGCVGNQGQTCQSGPNSCGMHSTGTIQCNGSCNAGAPPPDSACTQGSFEGFSPACVNATGWSWDRDATNAPAPVKLYDRDLAIFPAATPVVILNPATYRADLDNGLNGDPTGRAGNGNHSFNWPIPVSYFDNTARTFYGYVVNINSAGAPAGTADIPIGSHPLQCNNPPALMITSASCAPDAVNTVVTVIGTATDAPAAGPLTVKLYKNSVVPANLLNTGAANPSFSLTGGFGPFIGGVPVTYTIITQALDAQGGPPAQNTQIVTCDPLAPTVTISTVPASVPYNGQSQITWNSTGATSCTASDGSAGWAGPRPISGMFLTGSLTALTTYTLTCANTSGSAAQSAVVTVGSPPPPTVVITNISQPDYCTAGPEGIVTWQYKSPAGLLQKQWQMQVATDPFFVGIVYDSAIKTSLSDTIRDSLSAAIAKVMGWLVRVVLAAGPAPASPTNTASTGQGVLRFATTYWARVKVWDTSGTSSAWSPAMSFSTPAGPYPRVSFTVTPPKPAAKQETTFTDTSDYGGAAATERQWDFGDGTIVTGNPGSDTITHTYVNPGNGVTATLKVSSTNSGVQGCVATVTLNINKPIPSYREVLPGTASSPTPSLGQ